MQPQAPATVSLNVEKVSRHFLIPPQPDAGEPVVFDPAGEVPAHSPKLTTDRVVVPHEVRSTAQGGVGHHGVFATETIAAGTPCVVFGGFVTPGPLFRQLPNERQQHSLQIGDDLFLACDEELSDGDLVNHSCEPTLWFGGEITLMAIRDIEAGEQLTFDYATCDSQPYDEFECECESGSCRIKVTGEDWLNRELQMRYRGRFSPYLQRRIDSLPS